MKKYMDRHIATLFAMTDTKNPSKIEGFFIKIQLIFSHSEECLDDSKHESKYCRSPKAIGTKSANKVIHEENHEDIDHERYETESEPIERCCEHLQEHTNCCIH